MADKSNIERCGLEKFGQLCVLEKGHDGPHCFRVVPTIDDNSLPYKSEPVYDAFCPYCGSRPMLEGPGCKECGGEEFS